LDIRLAARRLSRETIEEAIRSLIEALSEGRVKADGLNARSNERAVINNLQWPDLRLFAHDEADRVNGWRKVRFTRENILALWPEDRHAHEPSAEERPPPHPMMRAEMKARALDITKHAAALNGGFISQAEGAALIIKQYPDFGRDRARKIVRDVTGNTTRGPRGPRNNSAE
jgi:hypothetical protein